MSTRVLETHSLRVSRGLTTLKIYQADKARHEVMDEEAERFRAVTMRVLRTQLNSIVFMDVGAFGGAAAGMGMALWLLSVGSIDFTEALLVGSVWHKSGRNIAAGAIRAAPPARESRPVRQKDVWRRNKRKLFYRQPESFKVHLARFTASGDAEVPLQPRPHRAPALRGYKAIHFARNRQN